MGATLAAVPTPPSIPATPPVHLHPGIVLGRLTLLSKGSTKGNHRVWRCQCSCGQIVEEARGDKLRNGRLKSCGCLLKEQNLAAHENRIEREAQRQAAIAALRQKRTQWRVADADRKAIQARHRDTVLSRFGSLSFESRHKHYLVKSLESEGVPKTDLIWNVHFYTGLMSDLACHYCDGLIGKFGHGLDRIDNSKKHIAANVVPCCGFCNKLKGAQLTYEEMVVLSYGLQEIRQARDIQDATS